MKTSYTPVDWTFREIIEEEIVKQTEGKIFYFGEDEFISEAKGKITALNEWHGQGLFVALDSHAPIRIDRIITLFGKPGPSYDEYDAYANACLDCKGGYDD